MHEFNTRRRIEFADTDMGGIVHFSRYFIFMETAEHELLERLGISVVSELDGKRILWPRVAAKLQFKSPARFGDLLDLHLEVVRRGRSSLNFRCRIELDGKEITVGEWTTVCCEMEPGQPLRAIPIPGPIAERIGNL